jgi:hypothetical protein
MPVILGLLALITAVGIWMYRARMAADTMNQIGDLVGDVASAARRLGFRRRNNMHPVESLDEPNVAIAGAAVAFLEMGGIPTAEAQDKLNVSLQHHLSLPQDQAAEAIILGRWLMTESMGPQPGFVRLVKRLYKLRAHDGFAPLMAVIGDAARGAGNVLTPRQRDALDEVRVIYKLTAGGDAWQGANPA